MLPLEYRRRADAPDDAPLAVEAHDDAADWSAPHGSVEKATPSLDDVALIQGAYFILTGVWAIVSIGTFQRITGPKRDTWLVKTVGALVIAIGGVLMAAGLRRRADSQTLALGAGTAAAFTAVDVWYVARRRISPVYLLDAVAECVLVSWWLRRRREAPSGAARLPRPADARR
jgi:hypothetical protein